MISDLLQILSLIYNRLISNQEINMLPWQVFDVCVVGWSESAFQLESSCRAVPKTKKFKINRKTTIHVQFIFYNPLQDTGLM
jgi:hypothetical protein